VSERNFNEKLYVLLKGEMIKIAAKKGERYYSRAKEENDRMT
jgi:hypothetical protein